MTYDEWHSIEKEMPQPNILYFVTDGERWAMAKWSIKNMWWSYVYHSDILKVTHFMKVKIPKPPNYVENNAPTIPRSN